MKNYKSLFLINMEKASSCVVFTYTYIPVTYMVFLTVEVIWKLATIRVINSSHKHSHAPVASLFLAYILTSWPEQKRKATATTKEKVKKYYTPPNKKSWFQINDFEKSLSSFSQSRSSWVTADVQRALSVQRRPVLSGFSEAMQRSVNLCFLAFFLRFVKNMYAVTHGFTLSILQNHVLLGTTPQA